MTSLVDHCDGVDLTDLKFNLLAAGARLDAEVQGRTRHRVRSGSCGGLDLQLGHDVFVNVPVDEVFAGCSPYWIAAGRHESEATIFEGHDAVATARLLAEPAHYATGGGRAAPVCFDRLGLSLTNACRYWTAEDTRCRFCSIGLNVSREGHRRTDDELIAAAAAALSDDAVRVAHTLIGGGTPPSADAGAARIGRIARELKAGWPDRTIYAMLVPPDDDGWINHLAECGVDEIALNIEVYSDEAAHQHLRGKRAAVPLDKYERALRRAVDVVGAVNTRSIMVVGLESEESLLSGVEWLASMGVMPILSPLRPLNGTPFEGSAPWPAHRLLDLTIAAAEVAGRHSCPVEIDALSTSGTFSMPLGPLCIPCQANTLTVPGHPLYGSY